METGTLIALAAMLISLSAAVFKYLDRRKNLSKERLERAKKDLNADVERDSLVVRGAEGALLLMEKTMKTANDECEKRIDELEDENNHLQCELKSVKTELREVWQDNTNLRAEIEVLRQELMQMNTRLKKVE